MSMLMMFAALSKGPSFAGFSTEYTSAGGQTVTAPVGATKVTIECIGAGGTGYDDGEGFAFAGGGGAYSKTLDLAVTFSQLHLNVPQSGEGISAVVRVNNSSGQIVCEAKNGTTVGGLASQGVGDIKYTGGSPSSGSSAAGGGAAGPNGNGGNASGTTPGSGNGFPAGNGGTANPPGMGQPYGGGGGSAAYQGAQPGRQGWIKLTWS